MVFITDKDFLESLDNYLVSIIKDSHPYTSKQTILKRFLYKCADTLSIDLIWPTDKNIIYIHPDNMSKIDLKWKILSQNQLIKISYDEQNVYKILKYSDFVHILDMQKLICILANKHEEDFLAELLAIDGFHGHVKNYINNLNIGEKGSTHVHSIRNIYKNFKGCPVKIVHFILLKIYVQFTKDDEIQQLVQNTIRELEKEIKKFEKYYLDLYIEKIKDFYITTIDNLQTIAMTKLAQLKILNKKNKKIKRNKQLKIPRT